MGSNGLGVCTGLLLMLANAGANAQDNANYIRLSPYTVPVSQDVRSKTQHENLFAIVKKIEEQEKYNNPEYIRLSVHPIDVAKMYNFKFEKWIPLQDSLTDDEVDSLRNNFQAQMHAHPVGHITPYTRIQLNGIFEHLYNGFRRLTKRAYVNTIEAKIANDRRKLMYSDVEANSFFDSLDSTLGPSKFSLRFPDYWIERNPEYLREEIHSTGDPSDLIRFKRVKVKSNGEVDLDTDEILKLIVSFAAPVLPKNFLDTFDYANEANLDIKRRMQKDPNWITKPPVIDTKFRVSPRIDVLKTIGQPINDIQFEIGTYMNVRNRRFLRLSFNVLYLLPTEEEEADFIIGFQIQVITH